MKIPKHSFLVISITSVFVIALGLMLLQKDLQGLVDTRKNELERLGFLISGLLPAEAYQTTLFSKDERHPERALLTNWLRQTQQDLKITGGIHIVSLNLDSAEIVASSSDQWQVGEAYPFSADVMTKLYSHMAYVSPLQNHLSEHWIEVFAPIFTDDAQLEAALVIYSNESNLFWQLARFSWHYVFIALFMAIFAILAFWVQRRRLSNEILMSQLRQEHWAEESQIASALLNDQFKIVEANVAFSELFEKSFEALFMADFFKTEDLGLAFKDHLPSDLKAKARQLKRFRFQVERLCEDCDQGSVSSWEVNMQSLGSENSKYRFQIFVRPAFNDTSLQTIQVASQTKWADGLTQLPNAAYFKEFSSSNWKTIVAQNSSLILFDIDDFSYFAHINGENEATKLIKEFSQALRGFLRKGDHIVHLNKDQFAVILPHTTTVQAAEIAKNFYKHLKNFDSIRLQQCFFSVGIAQATEANQPSEWVDSANAALNRAKSEGKARIEWQS